MKENSAKKERQPSTRSFNEMSYAQLANVFSMYSPHLLPIMRCIEGFIDPKVIVCSSHQMPLIVIDGEEQPCLLCSQENFEEETSKRKKQRKERLKKNRSVSSC